MKFKGQNAGGTNNNMMMNPTYNNNQNNPQNNKYIDYVNRKSNGESKGKPPIYRIPNMSPAPDDTPYASNNNAGGGNNGN